MPIPCKAELEHLYARFTHRCYVEPDPLQVLYRYAAPRDREVAGFIAAALAFGNVRYILRSVETVLGELKSPHRALSAMTPRQIAARFAGFRHRYAADRDLIALLCGISGVIRRHGSLEACFALHLDPRAEDVSHALEGFARELRGGPDAPANCLVPDPARGSACKRMHLFLRWMVRQDAVDPGGWQCVSTERLLVPMDTHMHRIARALGLTRRNQADLRAARETTAGFRAIAPADPVRYDFALTRLGIQRVPEAEALLRACVRGGSRAGSHVRTGRRCAG